MRLSGGRERQSGFMRVRMAFHKVVVVASLPARRAAAQGLMKWTHTTVCARHGRLCKHLVCARAQPLHGALQRRARPVPTRFGLDTRVCVCRWRRQSKEER